MNFEMNERSRINPDSREVERSCPKVSRKILLFIIVILVTVGIGLSITIANLNAANDQKVEFLTETIRNESNICFSLDCITEASNLMNSMDLKVDPCTDFYSFVCGNWVRNAHLAGSLESQFTELTSNIIYRVRELLEDSQKHAATSEHEKKVTQFYEACIDTAHRKVLGSQELLSDLKKFGGWPLIESNWNPKNFDLAKLMVELFKNGYISNMFFTVKVKGDVLNTSRSLIKVDPPSFGLKNKLYYSSVHQEKLDLYKNAIYKLAKKLENAIDEAKTRTDIDQAFEIEMRLASLSKDYNEDYTDPMLFYNIYSLKELVNFTPKVPWSKILNGLLPPGTEVMENDRILVPVPSIIKGLNDILDESGSTDQRAIANYIFYRVVFSAAQELSNEYSDIVNEVINENKEAPEWETCVKSTMNSFPHSLTASYVKKYMKNESKTLLDMMVQDLRKSLTEQIRNSDWLDRKTKEYALFKVKEMKEAIAYRDEIMNDTVVDDFYSDINISDNHFRNTKEVLTFKMMRSMQGLHQTRLRSRWDEIDNLLSANAYYHGKENTMIIPVGFIQNTIFASQRPNYINYGSLGMVVAHELTHGFDSLGSHFDAEGSYRMWWTDESWEKFLKRTKCYEEQYNKYYMEAVKSYVNGTMTLAENIADNGGLRTAYQAYKKLLNRIGSEKGLPGLPYNEKQMFWISFSTVWCRKQTEDSLLNTLKHSMHTHSQFRVIGSLSNMKEFSEDFKCKLNTPLNPEKKCTLWT